MKPASCYLLGYIFIFLLQAVSSDEDRKKWSFSFIDSIKAQKNSDMSIPCTFTSPKDSKNINLIWYKYDVSGHPQVFNSKDPSRVIEEYRGRTSLVSTGTNNCTLRIKDVRETEWFYPGISEDINSYSLNNSQNAMVKVTVVSSDEDRKEWSFSFPDSIKALKNSDVTIPCTFTAPIDLSEVNLVWFKYQRIGYPQIFNSKDPSQVIEEYRGRTSLVDNGTNNCTLRIKDVKETEGFYPGINKEINSYDLNNSQSVQVKVTGCSDDKSCEDWKFTFPLVIFAVKGSCVDIPCTFTRPEDAKDYNFFWYSRDDQAKIFNNKTPNDVADEYKGRTFLTGNTENNCSIKIINVEKTERYYPGINIDINSDKLENRYVLVSVTDTPPEPSISGTENLEDKKMVIISCAVNHTCLSHPPTLTWNITGHPIMENHKDLHFLGRWTMESRMTYTASYTDDKTVLQCAATFPNNKTSVKIITLNIKYRPRSVTISVDDDKNAQEGDDVTLLCSSQANPPVNNYTWYRIGEGGKLLHGHGDKISVNDTTTEKYICAATNYMGTEESSVFEYSKQYNPSYAYLAFLGVICLLLLALIIYFCWRKKTFLGAASPQPSDTTYTSLRKRETEDEYTTIQPAPPGGPITQGRDVSKNADYENLHKKT
ncbi:uncharacterized protein LOC120916334 isoform X2 [Rana temporaria]|uniref:uncharacterized protein LOC120916334 isoform X2 n=1 Tax=Rana temporaria TaxID=8407 RepID=UPI001AAD2C0D|nr:uncharacterized protein LOC120916334 isoform X2 [Rana temporaria]